MSKTSRRQASNNRKYSGRVRGSVGRVVAAKSERYQETEPVLDYIERNSQESAQTINAEAWQSPLPTQPEQYTQAYEYQQSPWAQPSHVEATINKQISGEQNDNMSLTNNPNETPAARPEAYTQAAVNGQLPPTWPGQQPLNSQMSADQLASPPAYTAPQAQFAVPAWPDQPAYSEPQPPTWPEQAAYSEPQPQSWPEQPAYSEQPPTWPEQPAYSEPQPHTWPEQPAYSEPQPPTWPEQAAYSEPQPWPEQPAYSEPQPQSWPEQPSYSEPQLQTWPEQAAYSEPQPQAWPEQAAYSEPQPQTWPEQAAYSEPQPQSWPEQPAYNEPQPLTWPEQPAYSEPQPQAWPDQRSYSEPQPQSWPEQPAYSEPQSHAWSEQPAYSEPQPQAWPEQLAYSEPQTWPEQPAYSEPQPQTWPEQPAYSEPQPQLWREQPAYSEPQPWPEQPAYSEPQPQTWPEQAPESMPAKQSWGAGLAQSIRKRVTSKPQQAQEAVEPQPEQATIPEDAQSPLRITLLAYTPEPEKVVAAAARLCYSPLSGQELMDNLTPEKVEKFLQKLSAQGHFSPFEHAVFTFAVDGVSRSLSHQLVRHRIASYSQKSQRYVKENGFQYVIPPAIAANPSHRKAFRILMKRIEQQYSDYIDAGVKPEDARALLPNAATTNLVVTMNARSLHNFFRLRCCRRAQTEIRLMARQMLVEVRQVAPNLFVSAGPSCMTEGVCYEGAMSCGKVNVPIRPGRP